MVPLRLIMPTLSNGCWRREFQEELSTSSTRPLQAFDAGGRARALSTIVEAMAKAKEAGLAPGDVGAALRLVDWQDR